MQRRAAQVATTVAVLGLTLAISWPAGAAESPRLEGKFDLRGKVVESTPGYFDAPAGSTVERTWKFFPTCPNGPCREVRLRRQIAGSHDNTALRRHGNSRYVGFNSFTTEVDGCSLDGKTTIRLRVQDSRLIGGELRVTEFKGRWVVEETSSQCGPARQVAKLRGALHSASTGP